MGACLSGQDSTATCPRVTANDLRHCVSETSTRGTLSDQHDDCRSQQSDEETLSCQHTRYRALTKQFALPKLPIFPSGPPRPQHQKHRPRGRIYKSKRARLPLDSSRGMIAPRKVTLVTLSQSPQSHRFRETHAGTQSSSQ
ncbi:hypothetical protein TRVL_08362 [Trypanosoma vivax]|nr:hypothetical protein TRVL_08362 [Trypanosoma vivax]